MISVCANAFIQIIEFCLFVFFLEECGTSSIAFKILKRSDYKGKFATFGLKLADKRLALKLLLTLTLTYRLRVTLSHLR